MKTSSKSATVVAVVEEKVGPYGWGIQRFSAEKGS